MERQKFSDMKPNARLLYLVFYEHQHLAGRKSISKEMAFHFFEQAVKDFGSIENAVDGVSDRCGFDPSRHFDVD